MSPDQVRDAYRRMIDAAGQAVKVRRYTGAGTSRPYFDAEVRARVTAYETKELVGAIREGDRKVILLAEDLVVRQFALPLRKEDKVVIGGREMTILAPDDNTRRVGSVLVAYELQVRG